MSSRRPPVLFMCRKGHPEPILAIEKYKIGGCQLHPIDLGQKFLNMAIIRVELLNRAGTNVRDNNRAVIGHCQSIGFASQSTEKFLIAIRADASNSTASIRGPERAVGLRNNRFRAYQVVTSICQFAKVKSKLLDRNASVAHLKSFLSKITWRTFHHCWY